MSESVSRRSLLGMRRSLLGMRGGSAGREGKPLRVGIVGVGNRGTHHLELLLHNQPANSVEIKALCDVDEGFLYRAKKLVQLAGRPAPELYSRGKTDYLRLCDRDDLDLVVAVTPWQFHTPICIAAMRTGKHAAAEVPIAFTMEDCWQLVETSEKTGKQCVMLEEAQYSPRTLAILNMAQKGVFGDLLHTAGGYVHDLRLVKFDPEREPWRLQHSIDRTGDLYPTHGLGPMAWWLNINRGDRFDYLVSVSTRSYSLKHFAEHFYGDRNPYANTQVACGDVNTALLHTVGGRTVMLYFDTNTPHPHTAEVRLEGTRGVYSGMLRKVYIEGRSPQVNQWEPFSDYLQKYQGALWKDFMGKNPSWKGTHNFEDLTTALLWSRFVEALRTGHPFDQNVYDAVTWSAVTPLTARSVGAKGMRLDFPDFTRGRWKNTPPVSLSPVSLTPVSSA